jgi:hypothetical protein
MTTSTTSEMSTVSSLSVSDSMQSPLLDDDMIADEEEDEGVQRVDVDHFTNAQE